MSGALPPPPLNAPRGSKRWIFYQSLNGHREGPGTLMPSPALPHAGPPAFPRTQPGGEKPGFAPALPPSACRAVCDRETSPQ